VPWQIFAIPPSTIDKIDDNRLVTHKLESDTYYVLNKVFGLDQVNPSIKIGIQKTIKHMSPTVTIKISTCIFSRRTMS
jgi:hypothetical protein